MTVGERIKEERIAQGITQQELAERMGKKSKVSVCRVESNNEDLTVARLMAYAKALNVPIDKLIRDNEPKEQFVLSDTEKDIITKLRCIDKGTYDNILTLIDVSHEKYLHNEKVKLNK